MAPNDIEGGYGRVVMVLGRRLVPIASQRTSPTPEECISLTACCARPLNYVGRLGPEWEDMDREVDRARIGR